jgi:hypothetical protein
MDRYIEQLISDINNSKKQDKIELSSQSFDEEMEEIERFVSEDPEFTLGHQIKLDKNIFPPKEKLSKSQCNRIVEALKDTYSSYLISLDIPDKIPIETKYEFYVNFLEQKVFMSDYTNLNADFCSDDFSICPFGVSNCKCYKNWKKDVKRILKKPEEDRSEFEMIEIAWYYLIKNHELALSVFHESESPNKKEISQILKIIEKATLDFVRAEGVIWYSPEENQIPKNPVYKQIFEWMGFEKITFLDPDIMTDIEIEALGYQLLKFFGKEDISFALMGISPVKRYLRLVDFFNGDMTMGDKMHFFSRPIEIFPHEIPDLLGNLEIDFLEDETKDEEDQLPF